MPRGYKHTRYIIILTANFWKVIKSFIVLIALFFTKNLKVAAGPNLSELGLDA